MCFQSMIEDYVAENDLSPRQLGQSRCNRAAKGCQNSQRQVVQSWNEASQAFQALWQILIPQMLAFCQTQYGVFNMCYTVCSA